MPKVDGYKVATMIKSIETLWFKHLDQPDDIRRYKTKQHCPIVAITAFEPDSIKA
jgi:CheY-like chemotaxis protein